MAISKQHKSIVLILFVVQIVAVLVGLNIPSQRLAAVIFGMLSFIMMLFLIFPETRKIIGFN